MAGEAAAEASLTLSVQLLSQLHRAHQTNPLATEGDRQEQHRLQQQLREILTHLHQAQEAHAVILEAPQWSQPTTFADPANPDHPTDDPTANLPNHIHTHPADVIGLQAGGTESNHDRPQGGSASPITTARRILAQLTPFLVQEEAKLAAQALSAIDGWLAMQWGEGIVLLDTQAGETTASPGEPAPVPLTPSHGRPPPSHTTFHLTHQHNMHPRTTCTSCTTSTKRGSPQKNIHHRTTPPLHQRGRQLPEGGNYVAVLAHYPIRITTAGVGGRMKGLASSD